MFKLYDIDIIPIILDEFKIKHIVLSGLSDTKIVKLILEYCDNNNVSYTSIDSRENYDIDFINDYTLNVLPSLSNFDAIFINDDSNWYTVYNELKYLKKSNDNFPLTFICNNVFPNKYRDSYIDPKIIPKEYLNDFSLKIPLNEDTFITDGLYHALAENTPKNGVNAAISDFLNENYDIGIMDLKLLNGITILYSQNSINHIRFGNLCNALEDYDLKLVNVSDEIIENQMLLNYISNIPEGDVELTKSLRLKVVEKEKTINRIKYESNLNKNELDYKNSQIQETNQRLNLKNSKIKDLESKLYNKENEIQTVNHSLKQVNSERKILKENLDAKEKEIEEKEKHFNTQINSLKKNIAQKEEDFNKKETELNKQITIIKQQNDYNDERLSEMDSNITYKNIQIRIKDEELLDTSNKLDQLKKQSNNQISRLESNEYCIHCYKEKIENNNLEIEYLKNSSIIKRLKVFEYLVLILKSNPKEIAINYKLYKALKNSKCFDIGFYLNNNKDIITSSWCKYFSPELHYVCNGFNEKRKFNKKYFNRNSKKELLTYIMKCP